MPVCMGIACERCRTVHFIPSARKSNRIRYDKTCGEYRISCISPCADVISFRTMMMKPYSVSPDVLERGYASIEQCKPLTEIAAVPKQKPS
jgi:hypothetical protein